MRPSKEDLTKVFFAVYIAGSILTWTFLIAFTINSGDDKTLAGSVLAGWAAGLMWPFTILVALWLKIWF